MNARYGSFDIEVWEGGHPVWIMVRDREGNELKLHHGDLRDLLHAVKQARRAARAQLKRCGQESEA